MMLNLLGGGLRTSRSLVRQTIALSSVRHCSASAAATATDACSSAPAADTQSAQMLRDIAASRDTDPLKHTVLQALIPDGQQNLPCLPCSDVANLLRSQGITYKGSLSRIFKDDPLFIFSTTERGGYWTLRLNVQGLLGGHSSTLAASAPSEGGKPVGTILTGWENVSGENGSYRAESGSSRPWLDLVRDHGQEAKWNPFAPPPPPDIEMSFTPGSLLPEYKVYTPAYTFAEQQNVHITDQCDTESLLDLLPVRLREVVQERLQDAPASLLSEIIVDEGRPVKLKFRTTKGIEQLDLKVPVSECVALLKGIKSFMKNNLEATVRDAWIACTQEGFTASPTSFSALSPREPFGSDGRMSPPALLHRISGMQAGDGTVYALTYRVGRVIEGLATIFSDLCAHMGQDTSEAYEYDLPPIKSILIVGKPGSGKTSLLRDIARIVGEGRSTIVVDSSSEIGGDSTVPHPCIGNARRFVVPDRERQHKVLVEAVQNHGPEVLVVDELSTPKEVAAARTISQRGVSMIATAHGSRLEDLLRNPELVSLCGGVQAVTTTDAVATTTRRGSKTRRERMGPPIFTTVIEITSPNEYRVIHDVAEYVDNILSEKEEQQALHYEVRRYAADGAMLVNFSTPVAAERAAQRAAAVKGVPW